MLRNLKRSWRRDGKIASELKPYFCLFDPTCPLREGQCRMNSYLFFSDTDKNSSAGHYRGFKKGVTYHADNFFQL